MRQAAIPMKPGVFLLIITFMIFLPTFGQNKMIRSKQGNENSNLQQPLPSQDEWWKLFKDPILDSLIIKAVNKNYDVRIAIRKIEMAKSKLRVDRSPYYPSIDLTVNYAPEKSSLSADKKTSSNGTEQRHLI